MTNIPTPNKCPAVMEVDRQPGTLCIRWYSKQPEGTTRLEGHDHFVGEKLSNLPNILKRKLTHKERILNADHLEVEAL